jgi:hypothetical protein
MGTDLGLWSLPVRLRAVRRILAPLALLGDHLSTSREAAPVGGLLLANPSSLGTSRFRAGCRSPRSARLREIAAIVLAAAGSLCSDKDLQHPEP